QLASLGYANVVRGQKRGGGRCAGSADITALVFAHLQRRRWLVPGDRVGQDAGRVEFVAGRSGACAQPFFRRRAHCRQTDVGATGRGFGKAAKTSRRAGATARRRRSQSRQGGVFWQESSLFYVSQR